MNFLNYAIFIRLSLAAPGFLLASLAFAQIEFPAGSFSDHSLLDGFPDSEIISRQLMLDVNHSVVLGSLQRVRGQVVSENSERLRGDLSTIVYEVSQEFSGEDVYQYFREQMEAKNYTELFNCSGRVCGSSNFWANDIFSNRILYGPERNQYYLVMRTNTGLETESYIALYIITRGNRKIYTNLEIVELGGTQEAIPEPAPEPLPESVTEAASPEQAANLLSSLQEKRSIVLPALEFVSDTQLTNAGVLSSTVEMLNSAPAIRVYLVAHLQGEQELEVLLQRSVVRATTVRASLINLGVDGDRIIAQGIGPLAPACEAENCEERIELVLQ